MNSFLIIVVLITFFALLIGGMLLIALKLGVPLSELIGPEESKGKKIEYVKLYEKQSSFLSKAELSFYRVLRGVLMHPTDAHGVDQALVMCKVRVADLVGMKKGLSQPLRQSAFNRIKAKHVDFVLVRPEDMTVMCVIELDDSSHRQKKVQERDRLMDLIYGAVGLPIVHVPCQREYVKEEVAGVIREAMGR